MYLKRRHYQGLLALILLSVIIISTQCIEEYTPDISAKDDLLVVNGSIIRGNNQQTIVISRSTSVKHPRLTTVKGCNVFVTDDNNNIFQFEEGLPGRYNAKIDSAYLEIGAKFKLSIETPNKQVYESSYEEIYESPPIDNLYFIHETNSSDKWNSSENGIRLNVDVYADEEYIGYYRWKIHETWELQSSNSKIDKILVGVQDTFITKYRYDTLNSEWIPDRAIPIPKFAYFNKPDTFHNCYLDAEVEEFFFSSTSNIVANSRKRVPLHFVPNGVKLSSRYSCLVSQYTYSEDAYNYWQNKVAEIKETGGIYFAQPSQNKSNIKNINNDQEVVLGYFWVSSYKEKRIFFEGPYLGRIDACIAKKFDIQDFYQQDPDSAFGVFRWNDSAYFPVYIINDNTYPPGCFDCRFSGGILDRPDFW